jgi:NAD(P)-dependent dehydrogenase (short-subunit alcohol dehydrogenase family)
MTPTENVVITGAANGIGRATAAAFARRGARLFLCDLDQAGLESIRAELGDQVELAEVVDVGDRAAMKRFAEAVHGRVPAADVLVNNAGIGQSGGILETPLEHWDRVLRVNLLGVVHGSHFFAPPMVARRSGHIVNLSSMLGLYATPESVAYVATKFAVLGMTLSMRSDLASKGVRATAICPGLIATDIIDRTSFAPEREDMRSRAAKVFKSRGTPPAAVAQAIVDVIGTDTAVRPVTTEAWVAWGVTRFAPRPVLDAIGRLAGRMQQRLTTSSAPSTSSAR